MNALVANLCWLLCFFGMFDTGGAITYTLEDGVTWTAQLGQNVVVRATDRGTETVYTGEIDKLHELYVKVAGEPIFIEDIISVTVASKKTERKTEPEGKVLEPSENEKTTKQVVTGYVVVRLQGNVGIIPEDIAGVFSTEYISPTSIAKMLKVLHSYKKVQHVVFVIESTGGDAIEISKFAKVLDTYNKRFVFHAIVMNKDVDALQLAESCDGVFESKQFLEGGYDGVANAFAKANAQFVSEFQKMFWSELLQGVYMVQYPKAYEYAAKKTSKLLPIEAVTPKSIGEILEYVSWTEFPTKSKSSLYVIQNNKERQIKDMVNEKSKLDNLVQQVALAKMGLLGLLELKRIAEATNPNNFKYENSVSEWYDEATKRWYRTEELSSDSKTLWNTRTDDALRMWRTVVNTLNATYDNPLAVFAKIVRDEATSGTQREIRENAKLDIDEELIKLSNAYSQVYPLLVIAEQNILSLQGMYK